MIEKKINWTKHPILESYTLLLMHRYRESNNFSHLPIEKVQQLEDGRMEIHLKALEVLKDLGYSKTKAVKILKDRAEYLIDLKLRPLKVGENYCGLCREIIKTKEWKEHSKKQVHNYIGKEVMELRQMWNLVKMNRIDNKIQELREKNENGKEKMIK